MGAIQNSMNAMMGTIAGAAAFGKHIQNQQKEVKMANDKEALAIKQDINDFRLEEHQQDVLDQKGTEASEAAKEYRANTYDESGKIARNKITGRFVSSEEIENDEELINLNKAAMTAAKISAEHINAMIKQKELLKQRMEFFKNRTGQSLYEYGKDKMEVKK